MKKAEMTLNETMTWIIGVILLVLVISWIAYLFGDKIIQFFKNLPNF